MSKIKKVRSVSHVPATSRSANESGRKTERIPCVIHLSGKIAATCCIQPGKSVKTKKTPLKNCRIITTGETTADAPLPLLGTAAKAIPRAVDAALPKIMSHVKTNHLYGSDGNSTPKKIIPPASNRRT